MKKKISINLAILLMMIVVIGTVTNTFAASTPKELDIKKIEATEKYEDSSEKINYLVEKNIVEGYKDGELHLDEYISRAEMSKLIVYALGKQDLAKEAQLSLNPYSDISQSHWANGFINVGTSKKSKKNNLSIINGYPDGTFKPENNITYAELAKMLVVLVDENLSEENIKTLDSNWPNNWMKKATELELLDGINYINPNGNPNRDDAFVIFYNGLNRIEKSDVSISSIISAEENHILDKDTENKKISNKKRKKKIVEKIMII